MVLVYCPLSCVCSNADHKFGRVFFWNRPRDECGKSDRWSPSFTRCSLQAMARVWRDGQRKQVHIYRLITTVSRVELWRVTPHSLGLKLQGSLSLCISCHIYCTSGLLFSHYFERKLNQCTNSQFVSTMYGYLRMFSEVSGYNAPFNKARSGWIEHPITE